MIVSKSGAPSNAASAPPRISPPVALERMSHTHLVADSFMNVGLGKSEADYAASTLFDTEADAETLQHITDGVSGTIVDQALAGHPNTPEAALFSISKRAANLHVRLEVLKHRYVSARIIEELVSNSIDGDERFALICHKHASMKALVRLAETARDSVEALALRQRVGGEVLIAEALNIAEGRFL